MEEQTNSQQTPVQGSINLNQQPPIQSPPPQSNDPLSPSATDAPPPSDGRKIVRIALIIFSILFFITIIVLGVVAYQRNKTYVQNKPTPTPQEEVIVTPTLIPTNTPVASPSGYINNAAGGEGMVFTSNTLGIQFRYLPEEGGNQIMIEEAGNKVYVYPVQLGRDGGQWVEVFEKPADQLVTEAISQRFLEGKDPAKCFVEEVKDSERIRYEIAFDQDYNAPQEVWLEQSKLCSPEYARTNGLRYFWYDPVYPTKYAFFSIGQYAIMAGENTPWQDTIEIIN